MSEIKLKPCPFCGSDRIIYMVEGHYIPWDEKGLQLWYRCHCFECGADGMDTGMDKTMEEASKTWNRRDGGQ